VGNNQVLFAVGWLVLYIVLFYHRCAVGDLSGKFGQYAIRAENAPPRTLVATDSNLPLVGPYTGEYVI